MAGNEKISSQVGGNKFGTKKICLGKFVYNGRIAASLKILGSRNKENKSHGCNKNKNSFEEFILYYVV